MIPVHVLTGFLGSGKTTLLAALLRHPGLARTAVIINEFGAVGIDHDLVEAGEESFVELETGCLCCLVRGDLEATIADLLARQSDGRVKPFERMVIETSGLADPAPILQALMLEGTRSGTVAPGRVVTTVDAVNGLAALDREAQSARQLAVADHVVVTKADLVDADALSVLQARLGGLNPGATRTVASFGDIEPEVLFGTGDEKPGEQPWAFAKTGLAVPNMFDAATSGRRDGIVLGGHDPAVAFHVVRRAGAMRAATLPLFLEALAQHFGEGLLRLKGIVDIAERPGHPAVIHGVQHLVHAPEWLRRWPSADRSTRIVLIGRGLSATWAERLLDALETEVRELDRSPV